MKTSIQQAQISLSILPLQNLSDDPRIDMFCKGLVMDLTTDLSRFRSFQILPVSSEENISSNLDYIVKGLARFRNTRLQINLQLIQARENRLVWAEKFDDTLDHIFQIEEDIVQKIVVSLQQFVDHDVLIQIRNRALTNLNAYESWLYGWEELKKGTLESDVKAREFFQHTLELDPNSARAYTGMSLSYFNEWSCQLWDLWEQNHKGAIDWAMKAVKLDAKDHISTSILGQCYLFYKEYDKAEYYLRKTLDLNLADPSTVARIAFCFAFLGLLDEALELLGHAKKMQPGEDAFLLTEAFIYFENGLFEQTIAIGERYPEGEGWIDFPATLAAAYYEMGQPEKMWKAWKVYLHSFYKKIQPNQIHDEAKALEWTMTVNPYKNGTKHQAFWQFIKENLGKDHIAVLEVKQETKSIHTHQFTQEGSIWSLVFKGKSVQMPDLKGFQDIIRLLAEPNKAIHCSDLMGVTVLENGAPALDDKAKTAYQKRLLDIQSALEEAERFQHFDQIEKLQLEYDQLLDHLAQSVGKGGKVRKSSDSLEKARSAVTWRIRSAIKKIGEVHPELEAHLKASIKTGLFCTYQPEIETEWMI